MSADHALRHCDDKIYCNAAHTSYFMQLSSLCLAKAQMCRACSHAGGTVRALWAEKEGQSHEIPRDSVGVLDCALQSFTIVLSAVPRPNYSRNEIATREHARGSPLVGVRSLRSRVSYHGAMAVIVPARPVGRRGNLTAGIVRPKESLVGIDSRRGFDWLKYQQARRRLRSGTGRF